MWRATSKTVTSSKWKLPCKVRGLFAEPTLLSNRPLTITASRLLPEQYIPPGNGEGDKTKSSKSAKWVVGAFGLAVAAGTAGYLYYNEDARSKAKSWIVGEQKQTPMPDGIPSKMPATGKIAKNSISDVKKKDRDDEQDRKDGESQQEEKERAERMAELVKEKELAEAAIIKSKKNSDFEALASKSLTDISELSNMATKAQLAAVELCRGQAIKLKEAMDASNEGETLPQGQFEVGIDLLSNAYKAEEAVNSAILRCKELIEEARKDNYIRDNKNIDVYEAQTRESAEQVLAIREKLKAEEKFIETMKKMQDMQDKEFAAFLCEIRTVVPGFKAAEQGVDLSVDQLNALLAHGSTRCTQLKRQLTEQQLLEHQQLEEALLAQKEVNVRNSRTKSSEELDRQQEELELEREAELVAQNLEFEKKLKQKLTEQKAAHHENLQEMLALQQRRLSEEFDLALGLRKTEENHHYLDRIEKAMAKVQDLEAALEERADLEKVLSRIQDLNSSAISLMHAVTRDIDCEGDNYNIIKIDEALKRCCRLAEDNPFVKAVLHSIPPIAAERGIYSMSSLEKRFYNVYKQCIRGRLFWNSDLKPKYTDITQFENAAGMSEDELLTQAKYFMDNKHVSEAVRCLVQLDGKARNLSRDWIEEARTVLEARQAAEALLGYAQLKGIGTIF